MPAALATPACSSAGGDDRSSTVAQGLSSAPAALRVVGLPEAVGPQHLGISGPSPCPSAGPSNPGTNESRFWVPDGPPHAYVDPTGATRLIVPHLRTFPFVGNGLDSVALDCADLVSDSGQNGDPTAFDDDSWPQAPYRLADGRTFAINHHEYHAPAHGMPSVGTWYAALTLSAAPDGIHFARVPGDPAIARPAAPFADDGSAHGYSDPTNIMHNPVDGYFYLVSLRDDPHTRNCVLRTADLSAVTSWRTWNGSSYGGTPGNGGDCVDFTTPFGAFSPGSLTWSDDVGTAVYVAFGVDTPGRQGIFAFFDLSPAHDLSQWSTPILILEVPVPWGENPSTVGRVSWAYPSLVDPAAYPNYDHIGQRPYLYFVDGAQERDLGRVPVQLVKGSAEIRNRGQGFYRVGGGAYYSNGFNQYCAITSMNQLVAMGFTQPFDHLMPYDDHGALADAGVCGGAPGPPAGTLPAGFFTVGGAGYYANAAGHYCAIDSIAQWAAMGAPGFNAAPSYAAIPAAETRDPDCHLPAGFFLQGAAAGLANDSGHYCVFASPDDYRADGGPADSSSLPNYPVIPSSETNDGSCRGAAPPPPPPPPSSPPPLASGFYLVSGAGYYANAIGHACFVSSWPQWVAMGGPASPASATSIAAMPSSEAIDPPCHLPAALFYDGGAGYWANGAGHYCVFSSWASYKEHGGPDDITALPDFSPRPSSEVFDGACSP
ncbi:MAG TPA: hypothetical protein VN947_32050 [Polyangia bacterium]|nr:hypothetical protein [Polyangia bacterium]